VRGLFESVYLSCYFLLCELYSDRRSFQSGCRSCQIDLVRHLGIVGDDLIFSQPTFAADAERLKLSLR
jgi:hypothetical protein